MSPHLWLFSLSVCAAFVWHIVTLLISCHLWGVRCTPLLPSNTMEQMFIIKLLWNYNYIYFLSYKPWYLTKRHLWYDLPVMRICRHYVHSYSFLIVYVSVLSLCLPSLTLFHHALVFFFSFSSLPRSPEEQWKYPLNSMTMSFGKLYGENDLSTKKWVLSSLMRPPCTGRDTRNIQYGSHSSCNLTDTPNYSIQFTYETHFVFIKQWLFEIVVVEDSESRQAPYVHTHLSSFYCTHESQPTTV